MENISLFKDLALVFAAALLAALIVQRLKLPTILAYLGVGIALGPYGLKVVNAASEVGALGEIGVALLMFAVGVEFSFKKLAAVGKVAVWGGILQIALTLLLTAGAGWALGLPLTSALVLGCITAISSTMIVMKIMMERGEADSLQAQIMLGMLIVQDLAVVIMVAWLPIMGAQANSLTAVLSRLATAAGYLVLAFLVVRGALPNLMMRIAQAQNRELFNLSVVGICLGAAIGSYYLGLSLALGAFLAGLILGESDYHQQISATVAPLRDLFAMVFFVAIGMMFNFSAWLRHFWWFVGLLILIIALKPALTAIIIRAFGYSPRVSFLCGVGMGQIGEFSFLMASLGVTQGLLTMDNYTIIISAAMASLALSPFLTNSAPFVYRSLTHSPLWRKRLGEDEGPDAVSEDLTLSGHIIICGHANIYLEMVKFLDLKRIPWVALDDSRTLSECQINQNNACVYGDPSNDALIARLNPAQAKAAIIWIHDLEATRLAVKALRRMNPLLPIVASVSQPDKVESIRQAGANHIILPEFEASLEVLRFLMLILGTPLDEGQRYIEGIRLQRFHQFPHKPHQASLDDFSGHYILCGFGRLGRAVSKQLLAAQVPHVAIELNPERARRYGSTEIPVLWGNATKDRVLLHAGIKRAQGLVTATDSDSVNMHIILSARRLNPELDIIAYVGHAEAAENLRRAGAQKLFSPFELGGMRIAASIVSPSAANIMEKLLAPAAPGMEIGEIKIIEGSKLEQVTLKSSQLREKTGASIIALIAANGNININPSPDTRLAAGMVMLVMGTTAQIQEARSEAGA